MLTASNAVLSLLLVQVVSWFGSLGFAMPYGVNVADFLLDLAQGEVEGGDFSRLITQAASATDSDDNSHLDKQKVAAVPSSLSGTEAVRALYSSYETYHQKHRDGFYGTDSELADLGLALEPPLTKRQQAAAAAAIAAGKDPKAAVAAAGKKRSGMGGSDSFLNRSFKKAGSFLGLDSSNADQHAAGEQGSIGNQGGAGTSG